MFVTRVAVLFFLLGTLTSAVWAGQQLDEHDGSATTITSPLNGVAVERSFELM